MKKLLIVCLLHFQCMYGSDALQNYFSSLQQLNRPNGNFHEGEIEIVTNPSEISQIQQKQENRLLMQGFSKKEANEFNQVGIVAEDQYLIWLRDAVYFPLGFSGTYDRILWKNEFKSKYPGVAVLPVLPTGEIALILTYRHATRSWELEIPRGGLVQNETVGEAALRELNEETGLQAASLVFLGEVAVDSGILSSIVPVFLGKIISKEEASPESHEAITDVVYVTKEELKEGLLKGFLEVFIYEKKKQVPLRDAFLTFALLQAELRQLL